MVFAPDSLKDSLSEVLDIYNKNSHLIKDPDLIYPGQIFSLLD